MLKFKKKSQNVFTIKAKMEIFWPPTYAKKIIFMKFSLIRLMDF